MALDSPNDSALFNAIAHYEREIPGRTLTVAQLTRVVETAKRLVVDELHSAKAQS
jgi:hypothetical protein